MRDTFALDKQGDHSLVVASDRASIFDFVLPCFIPQKGEVLTAMTIFWLTEVLYEYVNHLVAYGTEIDIFLPEHLQGLEEIYRHAMVVENVDIRKVEAVVRGHLTGSGWKSYQKDGTVCGHVLPPGLQDGAKLPEPIFTPTSKEEIGHDEPMNFETVNVLYPWMSQIALDIFSTASEYAANRGLLIADTKFEFGDDGILADEVLTTDSSRIWSLEAWKQAQIQGTSPQGFDKEALRIWGRNAVTKNGQVIDIKKLDPESENDLAIVHNQIEVPASVIELTQHLYREAIGLLTESTLEDFRRKKIL